MKPKHLSGLAAVAWLALALPGYRVQAAAAGSDLPFPLIDRFENFTMKDGMPSHKVHCVLPASDGKLWVGTY